MTIRALSFNQKTEEKIKLEVKKMFFGENGPDDIPLLTQREFNAKIRMMRKKGHLEMVSEKKQKRTEKILLQHAAQTSRYFTKIIEEIKTRVA